MEVSRRTRCNYYAIVKKSNSGKITSAMSNQLMVGRWFWEIWGYEIVRTLGNEFKIWMKGDYNISGMWYYHTLKGDIYIYN